MASGLMIAFAYTSGDYRGDAFGCVHTNCRVPTSFGLVKVAFSP